MEKANSIETASTPSRTLKRFWLGAVALLTLLLTLSAGNFFLPQEKRLTGGMVGHDFLAFYTAGTFVRDGRMGDLYNLEKVRAFQHDLARRDQLEIGESFGPFWNPPFYAWVFVPLARLPYQAALLGWETINAISLCTAIALMIRLLRRIQNQKLGPRMVSENASPAGWRVWLLVPMLLLTSMPLIQAFTHGQNTAVSLLLLSLVATFWQCRRGFAAGIIAGLLFYKPQLGMVVAVALVLTLGWRAAAGLAIMGLALLVTTVLTMPATLTDYLAKMPGNLHQFQVEQVYLWDRHVTLRAFWRLLLQGRGAGEMTAVCKSCWIISCLLLAGMLARAWWKTRHAVGSDRAPLIAAVIAAMPLLMPFYFDYDLLLIAVSAVCYAGVRLRDEANNIPAMEIDRWITRAWIGLYLWLMVNSSVARLTGVNGTVVMLSMIAALMTRRAGGAVEIEKRNSGSNLHSLPFPFRTYPR